MKLSFGVSFVSLAVALSLFGSASAQDVEAMSKKAIEDYASAFNAKSPSGVAALYAQDAVIHAPNIDTTAGRAGIEAYITAQIEQAGARDLKITSEEIIQYGDAYVQTGGYTMTVKGPSGDMPVTGDWLSVATMRPDGTMEIQRHIWNLDMPMQ